MRAVPSLDVSSAACSRETRRSSMTMAQLGCRPITSRRITSSWRSCRRDDHVRVSWPTGSMIPCTAVATAGRPGTGGGGTPPSGGGTNGAPVSVGDARAVRMRTGEPLPLPPSSKICQCPVTGPSVKRVPDTNVPLVVPRSRAVQPVADGSSVRCRLLTHGSSTRTSASTLRPITTGPVAEICRTLPAMSISSDTPPGANGCCSIDWTFPPTPFSSVPAPHGRRAERRHRPTFLYWFWPAGGPKPVQELDGGVRRRRSCGRRARTRCSRWARTARASTVVSRSRPSRVRSSTSSRWLTSVVRPGR